MTPTPPSGWQASDLAAYRDSVDRADQSGARRDAEVEAGHALLRWSNFVWSLTHDQAGLLVSKGSLREEEEARRRLLQPWEEAWGGSLSTSIVFAFVSRMDLAASHANALGTLLVGAGTSPAALIVLRSFSEACARSIWVAAAGESPAVRVERMVATMVEDLRRWPKKHRERLLQDHVFPTAEVLGVTVGADRRGRPKTMHIWPDTRSLLESMAPSTETKEGVGRLYSQ